MTYRYPLASLYGDYLRSVIGLAFMATPLYFSMGTIFLTVIFGGLTLLFLAFGVRTAIRHFTVIEASADAIATVGPFGKRIAWSDITKVDLKYFSTRREKTASGWMQIKVWGGSGKLQVESNLEGFDQVAARIATAAFENGAEMNETTVENFTAMGVTVSLPEEDDG